MIDFVHIVVVMATLPGPGGSPFQEPRSAYKRGLTDAECKAAVTSVPVGAKTMRGDLVLVSMCAPAAAPAAPKGAPLPDMKLKGSI